MALGLLGGKTATVPGRTIQNVFMCDLSKLQHWFSGASITKQNSQLDIKS
jgi:hypothetical protein